MGRRMDEVMAYEAITSSITRERDLGQSFKW